MDLGLIGSAAAMFAATNIDDLVLLAVFFGRAAGRRSRLEVVAGQFLGFAGILAVSVAGALGAGLLPGGAVRWLGVLPILLGLRAAWQAFQADDDEPAPAAGVLGIALVCFANGGDNVGVYVPAFAASGSLAGYVVVFLAGVAVWCVAGRFLATRPAVAPVLARYGHVVLPVVLVGLGVLILAGVF
ncbi:cadmium resistance protein CadD (predicted permease) [Amycolatopsis lexingtonensis]|uniref:Cadmium resistance protein CadD (Predicted permease) n=1 Tax=Amycolatopsis lexingtonensis TaxID=218822 RepID=A0ABR9I7R3_9PSEU|nr:cadmium resistance transporter [Amycolatopsis lexingtonensis]MBE1499195.1 cadmium resistance protein CadD (predicted permease) [Amycolatopsis lexingtonensis]